MSSSCKVQEGNKLISCVETPQPINRHNISSGNFLSYPQKTDLPLASFRIFWRVPSSIPKPPPSKKRHITVLNQNRDCCRARFAFCGNRQFLMTAVVISSTMPCNPAIVIAKQPFPCQKTPKEETTLYMTTPELLAIRWRRRRWLVGGVFWGGMEI